jgi:GntR family transcriptional repressor for pyruvate dehydrogenase complex
MKANESTTVQTHTLFEAVTRETTLVTRVAQQIEDLIIQGRLQAGDQLPPEKELTRQFKVSRTVVREAVSGLIAKGLLETRPGGGLVVSSPSAQSVSQSITLMLRGGKAELDFAKVMEVRRTLEVEIARLAALRRTDEDIQQLEEILRVTEEACADRDRFAQCDVEFHSALARATHNELLSVLLDSISDVMFTVRQLGYEVSGTPERALRYHWDVFEQVKAGDPEGARRAMSRHMDEAEHTLRRVQAMHRG